MVCCVPSYIHVGVKVGILGGGQLGRMMGEAALKTGIQLEFVDPKGAKSPAGQTGFPCIAASYKDEKVCGSKK